MSNDTPSDKKNSPIDPNIVNSGQKGSTQVTGSGEKDQVIHISDMTQPFNLSKAATIANQAHATTSANLPDDENHNKKENQFSEDNIGLKGNRKIHEIKSSESKPGRSSKKLTNEPNSDIAHHIIAENSRPSS